MNIQEGFFCFVFCTVHFVNVNKRPTNAPIVIQYNSIFCHSFIPEDRMLNAETCMTLHDGTVSSRKIWEEGSTCTFSKRFS
jgi:hypothetical protein